MHFLTAASAQFALRPFGYWRRHWGSSLRARLLVAGLLPLVLAYPLVMVVLVLVGGAGANELLQANLRGSLAGSRSYLDHRKAETAVRVTQIVRAERVLELLSPGADTRELQRMLRNTADASGLDFLIVANADGRVIATSTGAPAGLQLPESLVVRQARIGVASAAYERFEADALSVFAPHFAATARGTADHADVPGALLINAAAHFPLATDRADAILVGGLLLNGNRSLIEHMREVIFPLGTLPDDAEGQSALYIADRLVAVSRQRGQEQRRDDGGIPPPAWASLQSGEPQWAGRIEQDGRSMVAGFAPLMDGAGRPIGMVAASFPDTALRKAARWMLGATATVLALTLLAISVVFLRVGSDLRRRLSQIVDVMAAVRAGDRDARVGQPERDDEPGQLARHFDTLLDTIATQDAAQRAAQQTIVDEASRRRALFEHERDGVIILNADGSTFEANPKGAAMLGYGIDEMAQLNVADWNVVDDAGWVHRRLASVDGEGAFFETTLRRKDGSTCAAEVSLSQATWSDRRFVLWLQRDIGERKAVEAELARYRSNLEALVEQRTQALNDRSAQLDAIFALSPDGFVSFDRAGRVALANRAFLQLTGMRLDGLIGLDAACFSARLSALCAPAAPFPGLEALRAARERTELAATASTSGDAVQRFELALPCPRVVAAELRLSDAAGVSQVLALRDITHETEVERMKSEFLTTAAHELRTPMSSIYGYAELLMARPLKPEKQREMLGTIAHQATLMSSIINELLDLARIESRRGKDLVIERAALQSAVAEAIAGFKPPPGRDGPVVHQPVTPLFAHFDHGKLLQVVTNILSNAYKYSPAGGEVCLRYLTVEATAGDARQARVGLAITDHGIGMTAQQTARVFERFYRADASGHIPGTGLGMSIVKELIEMQHGSIEIDSAPDAGTTVTLWLPRA